MKSQLKYDDAVKTIKAAILHNQYEAAVAVNERQLGLYFGIEKYISQNSRNGFWGKGAIDVIAEQLANSSLDYVDLRLAISDI